MDPSGTARDLRRGLLGDRQDDALDASILEVGEIASRVALAASVSEIGQGVPAASCEI